jgi:hypothetical protein
MRYHAGAIIEKSRQLKFEFLPYPPYSPELAPSHYYMFGPLVWTMISSDDEVKDAVRMWLRSQPKFSSQIGSAL